MGIEYRIDASHIDEDGVRVIDRATLLAYSITVDDPDGLGVPVFPVYREWQPTRCRCGKCGCVTGPYWIRQVGDGFLCPHCNGEGAIPVPEE